MADIRDDSKKGRSAQRDKKSRKMTRSEASAPNHVALGDEQRSDRRHSEHFNLQQPQAEHISSPEQHTSVRETIAEHNRTERTAQNDFRSDDAPAHTIPTQETPLRHAPSLEGASEQSAAPRQSNRQQSTMHHSQFAESADNNVGQSEQNTAPHNHFTEPAASHSQNMRRQASHSPDAAAPTASADEAAPTEHSGRLRATDISTTQSDATPAPDNHSRLRFSGDTPPDSGTKSQPRCTGARNQHFTEDARQPVEANTSTSAPAVQSDAISSPERPTRLRFADDTPPDSGAKSQAKRSGARNQHFTEDARQPVEANASTAAPATQSDAAPSPERPTRLRFKDSTAPDSGTTKPKAKRNSAQHQKQPEHGDDSSASAAQPDKSTAPADSDKTAAAGDSSAPPKKSKLNFSADETPPADVPPGKRLTKAHAKAEKSAAKLEAAEKKLPRQHRVRIEKEVDADTGKPKRKLTFEKDSEGRLPVKSQRAHVKGPIPLRPVKLGANATIAYGHKKIHEVEHENVGTKAAHKGELVAEGAVRRGYHLHKTRPYRRVAKLQKKSARHSINATYRQTLHDNPKLNSNALSRAMQKRKIKRQYAKTARDAKRAGGAVKKTGDVLAAAGKAVVYAVKSHPAVVGTLALILLLMFMIAGFFTSCSNMMSGGLSSVLASSYLAEEADIDNAELAYTEWETDLQIQINRTESDYPGYDEYRYSVDDIGHNPYQLMAFLTAMHQNFTYSQVSGLLAELFAQQYTLTYTPEIEIRYRTETRTGSTTYTDPDTGESYSEDYEYEVEVPYEWHILNVSLTARSFSDVAEPRLDSDQREIYDLVLRSKGNRQYLENVFDFNWLPYVSSYYGYRVHPISGEKNYHKGIDIAVAQGTPILAGHDGVITDVGFDAGGYGNYVVITGEDGLVSKYAHCETLSVSAGQEVKTGDTIATVGSTGNSTGPHLHLEIIKNGQYLNPAYFAQTGDDGFSSLPPGTPGGPLIPDYPGEPMGDGSFAALMEIAQAQLGKPYVFGTAGPDTFDCSGFVCYTLNNSGVVNVGRITAQGLYNISTPVSRENAMPGDLIFFHSTYSTASTVTHIGIYIGNGMMIHAGSPVQYASIDTAYWQEHLYAFGRIN